MPGTDRTSPRRRAVVAVCRHWAPYLLAAGTLFVWSAGVGAAVGSERDSPLLPVAADGNPYAGLDALGLFLHNARVGALLVLGALLFGLPTGYLLLANGFLFGSGVVEFAGAYGPAATIAMVLPHGVFELLALVLAGAVSFRWCHVGWLVASSNGPDTTGPRLVLETLLALATVAVLLALAAVIEARISSAIGGAVT